MKTTILILTAFYIFGVFGLILKIYRERKQIKSTYIIHALKYGFVFDFWIIVQIYRFVRSLYYANKPLKTSLLQKAKRIDK